MVISAHAWEMHRHFRQSGYLRVPGAVPSQLVEAMRNFVVTQLRESKAPYRTGRDGVPVRLDQVLGRDPVFLEALRQPLVLRVLTVLLGPTIILLTNRHNHATLNRRGDIPFRLHRDILQWSRGVVAVLLYLEDATPDNGCTHVVPGSHLLPFAGMPPDGGGGNWLDDHEEYQHAANQAVPVPMLAGGVLVLDSLVFHSVGENRTERSRASATFAMRSLDELDRMDGTRNVLLQGTPTYKGNDVDHNTVIPAFNKQQANM